MNDRNNRSLIFHFGALFTFDSLIDGSNFPSSKKKELKLF